MKNGQRRAEDEMPNGEVIACPFLGYLGRIELSFDRLMMFEREGSSFPYNEVLIDVGEIIQRLLETLPEDDRLLIDRQTDKSIPMVRGDILQFSFCLESILAYLLRFVEREVGGEKIRVAARPAGKYARIEIRGLAPEITGEDARSYADAKWMARAIMAIRLGEEIIRTLIESNMKGKWHGRKRSGNYLEFRFDVPTIDASVSHHG